METAQRWRGLTAAVAVVPLVLAGCGVRTSERPAAPDATVKAQWQGCWAVRPFKTAYEPNTVTGTGVIPRDFRPASAVECVDQRQRSADGSLVRMAIERRSSDFDALAAAFALPSIEAKGASCAGVGWERPWLFLLDKDGRWIYPQIPSGVCGQPRKEYTAAYESTPFRTAKKRLLRVEEPIVAIKAGCPGQETDMAWFVTLERRKKTGTLTTDPLKGQRAKLCSYSVAGTEDGPNRPGGRFVAGRRLNEDERAAIVKAMTGSPAAKPCRRPANKFAALHRTDNRGASVYVELTGCRRVVVVYGENHYLLSQASPQLLKLLDA